MAELIAIVGNSGSGKSSSIRTLDPASTFIINVAGKPLPFKGWKTKYPFLKKNENGQLSGNLHNTSNVDEIDTLLQYVDKQRKDIKVVVLEDKNALFLNFSSKIFGNVKYFLYLCTRF